MDNNEEVVVVKGLGRHLELQELKKKKDEEKRLREAEVFGINHKFAVNADQYDINNPNRHLLVTCLSNSGLNINAANTPGGYQTTIPKPFNLSHNQQFGNIRRQKFESDQKNKDSEYTFIPRTN